MSIYAAPAQDTAFVLDQLVDFDQLCQKMQLDEVNLELANVILEEAGKLASEVLAPLNAQGDASGARLVDDRVEESSGYAEAYQQYMENGWATLTAPEQFGGQALPNVLGTAVNELWHSANMAFALCPMLTQGSIEALIAHGSEALQNAYLPRLVSGEWTGTMNLTEPAAGSDLAAVATKAVPNGDHYLITGQKIYITWGDHQMTPNVVHLVLARLPDAPAGVKGISLFIVPKFLLDEEGNPAQLNDVKCIALEHKLGIHASPTCTMSFGDHGGAIGYLVGEANRGLAYMFTMMNHARQSVGLQGLAISERAYQQAVWYAKDRTQGSRKDGTKMPIIEHPDVRRMLMAQRTGCESMRGLALIAAAEIDRSHIGEGASAARVELLTPIVKGWMTEMANELTSLNIQVHGGMGFIEESGAPQHYRDARILSIYEGTNGIQALDLIGRKTISDEGAALAALLAEMASVESELRSVGLDKFANRYAGAVSRASEVRDWILEHAAADRKVMGAVAFDFLMMMGYLCGAWVMARSAVRAKALEGQESAYSNAFLSAKVATARFYAEHYLPRVDQHAQTLMTGLDAVFVLSDEQF